MSNADIVIEYDHTARVYEAWVVVGDEREYIGAFDRRCDAEDEAVRFVEG